MRRTRGRLGLGPAAADETRRKGGGGSGGGKTFSWLSDNDSDADLGHRDRDADVDDLGPAAALAQANELAAVAAVGKQLGRDPKKRNGAHDDSALNGGARAEPNELLRARSGAPAPMPNGTSEKTSSLEAVQSETPEKSPWRRALAALRAAEGGGGEAPRAGASPPLSIKYDVMRGGETRLGRLRDQLRVQLESPRFESVTLGLVLLYGLLVLTDLGLDGLELSRWSGFFRLFDITFLFLFMIESLTRLLVIGPSYLHSPLDLVDFLAILLSFLMMVALDLVQIISPEDIGGASALLLMVRFLRVFRLAAVMMRSIKTVANVAEHEVETMEHEREMLDAEREMLDHAPAPAAAPEAHFASHGWHHEPLSRAGWGSPGLGSPISPPLPPVSFGARRKPASAGALRARGTAAGRQDPTWKASTGPSRRHRALRLCGRAVKRRHRPNFGPLETGSKPHPRPGFWILARWSREASAFGSRHRT